MADVATAAALQSSSSQYTASMSSMKQAAQSQEQMANMLAESGERAAALGADRAVELSEGLQSGGSESDGGGYQEPGRGAQVDIEA